MLERVKTTEVGSRQFETAMLELLASGNHAVSNLLSNAMYS